MPSVTLSCQFCTTLNRVDMSKAVQGPMCAKCARPFLLDRPVKVLEEHFDTTVLKAEVPVLVDFYADWCGPCKMMAPHLDAIAQERVGTLLVAKVDTDRAPTISQRYGIRGIPFFGLFEKGEMAKSVVAGARSIPGTSVILFKVGDVTAEVLFGSDALVVGSPVYWSNMSGEVKAFFDRWQFEFGVFPELKMRNKVGAAFATGGQISSGKEVTMLTILAAMLGNRMIVVSDGGSFGASATTEGDSPGINDEERAGAWALGKRVAEVAWMVRRGQALPVQP